LESGIFTGTLRHRRFLPVGHDFTYPLFMVFLDIDQIPALARISPFLSYNHWNWASFDDRDHLGDPHQPLRKRLETDALANGINLPAGPIYLLTHLRYLGYCFNPVSFFYCYDRAGELQTVLAEVNSTFGETRSYWLPGGDRRVREGALHFRAPKTMHVSPFMAMDLEYDFILTPPRENLVVHMNTRQHGKVFFDATLKLEKHPWTSESLHRTLFRHPWMTAKVIGAIHWQALRLYFKKVPVFTHPRNLPVTDPAKISSARVV
jgi:hypothetical protein